MTVNYETCQLECKSFYYVAYRIIEPENPSSDYIAVRKCVEDCVGEGYCLTDEQKCVNECPDDWYLDTDGQSDRCTSSCSKQNFMCASNSYYGADEECGDVKLA